MEDKKTNLEEELDDLRKELENFQQEKERVRAIVGKIGGMPTFNIKLANYIFISVLVVSVIVSLIGGEKTRSLMIETAVIALSIKIIYMLRCQTKINHFILWVLSSIEWRLNELMKQVRKPGEK